MIRNLFCLTMALTLGCTAITDFDEHDVKVDITGELSDTLDVTIASPLANLVLEFDSQLPVKDATAIYDLIGDRIALQVINNENKISLPLTEHPVDDEPQQPGEYTVTFSDGNTVVNIMFYNETVEGQALRPGGNYSALLDIQNNDFFETGTSSHSLNVE